MEDWYSGLNLNKNMRKYEKEVRDDEDLEEEQVWAVLKQREVLIKNGKGNDQKLPHKNFHASPKMIPRASCSSNLEGNLGNYHQSSAPLNIPHWPRKCHSSLKGLKLMDYDDGYNVHVYDDDDDYVYDDDHNDGIIPPHEYIARRVARSGIASFSMCEGIGRTLKGRDLSKLRNAILTKTGFLEE